MNYVSLLSPTVAIYARCLSPPQKAARRDGLWIL